MKYKYTNGHRVELQYKQARNKLSAVQRKSRMKNAFGKMRKDSRKRTATKCC